MNFATSTDYGIYIDIEVSKVGNPTCDLVIGLYQNDATAGNPLGTPVQTFALSRDAVSGLIRTMGFFFSKMEAITANNFNLVVSTNGPADAANYYSIYSAYTASNGGGAIYDKTSDSWVVIEGGYDPDINIYGIATSVDQTQFTGKQVICVPLVSWGADAIFDDYGNHYEIDCSGSSGQSFVAFTSPIKQDGWFHTYSSSPYLTITERGANGTLAAAHGRTTASVYRVVPLFSCDRVEYFSSDPDLSLEDLTAEIARKAGVEQTIADDELIPNALAPSTGTTIPFGEGVVKFKLPALTGTVILQAWKLTELGSGVSFEISSTNLKYSTIETFPLSTPLVGDVVVSFYEDTASFWCNGNFVHAFHLTGSQTLGSRMASYGNYVSQIYLSISGTETAPIAFHIPESSIRIDNYILDNGRKGAQLIESLIGEKHFYYQDTADGKLRLFRKRVTINNGSPYRLTVSASDREEDVPGATWIRVEGGEIYEAFDEEMIKEYGMLFKLTHMSEVNNLYDAVQQADYVLEDYASRYETRALEGEADLRVEPNDVIYFETDQGIEQLIVDSVDFDLSVEGENARCSMTIDGRKPR